MMPQTAFVRTGAARHLPLGYLTRLAADPEHRLAAPQQAPRERGSEPVLGEMVVVSDLAALIPGQRPAGRGRDDLQERRDGGKQCGRGAPGQQVDQLRAPVGWQALEAVADQDQDVFDAC